MSRWPVTELGDLISFRGGGTPSKDKPEYWGNDIFWATVKDFKGLYLDKTRDSISEQGLKSSSANLIPAGHVIIPTRMALGKAAINTIDLAINQDLRALLPQKPLDTKYLLYSILGLSDQIEKNSSGATVKGITQEKLKKLRVPYPPLKEQKRIAKILDAADALRAKRRESLAQLDALLQSAFLDLFGDPATNEKKWKTEALADVVKKKTIVTYGIVQAGEEFPGGVPYIRTGDIVDGEIDIHSLRRTDPKIAEKFSRSRLDAGDLVMSIRATVGTVAMVPSALEGANLTQGTARISPGDGLSKEYLFYYIMSNGCQSWIQRQVKGATFREITLGRLRSMPVLVPPIDLQLKFSRLVQRVDELRSRSLAHMTDLDELFMSLQQKAFKGEL